MVQRRGVTTSIRFCGTRGGRHDLTWGQRDVYRALLLHSPHAAFFNLRTWLLIPPGTGLDRICDALRWAVEEYESLRTTYAMDAAGRPYQLVHQDGVVRLRLVDRARGEHQPGTLPEHLGREFDHQGEFPLRCVLMTAGGGDPAWLALEVSHLSADAAGGDRKSVV